MKLTLVRVIVLAVLVIWLSAAVFPALATTYNVNITLPSFPLQSELKVFDVVEDPIPEWTQVGSMQFGKLTLDFTNKIFRANHYHVIDAIVRGNTQSNWSVTVENQTFDKLMSPGVSLGEHVVVQFCRAYMTGVGDETDDEPIIPAVAYSACASRSFDKSTYFLSGGWLRIYYGFATGQYPLQEGGAVPPGLADTQAGAYSGNVLVTFNL